MRWLLILSLLSSFGFADSVGTDRGTLIKKLQGEFQNADLTKSNIEGLAFGKQWKCKQFSALTCNGAALKNKDFVVIQDRKYVAIFSHGSDGRISVAMSGPNKEDQQVLEDEYALKSEGFYGPANIRGVPDRRYVLRVVEPGILIEEIAEGTIQFSSLQKVIERTNSCQLDNELSVLGDNAQVLAYTECKLNM